MERKEFKSMQMGRNIYGIDKKNKIELMKRKE